jgi:hypothetical protein
LVVAVVSVAVLLAVGAWQVFLSPTNPRITLADFQRIKPGMTRKEVEGILGRQGDYRTGPTHRCSAESHFFLGEVDEPQWRADGAEIQIWWGPPDEVVTGSNFTTAQPLPVGMLGWLKWRWERWRNNCAP